MKILVTGATGQFGARAVERLLELIPADQVAVSVRQPERAEALRARGVDVRQGDFDDAASLDRAFAGVDRLLLVSTDGDNATRIRQHRTAVDAAQRAGVKHIVYTSVARADRSTIGLGEVHRATEAAIRETGIPFTFLRNAWYTENEAATVQGAAAGHPVVTSAGDARVSWASRDDYADAAAAVLAGSGHEGRTYELAGPPRSYEELAATIGEVLGRHVPVHQVDDAAFEQIMLGAGLPDFVAAMLVDFQRGIRAGDLDVESGDLERLLGRPVTPLRETIARLAGTAPGA